MGVSFADRVRGAYRELRGAPALAPALIPAPTPTPSTAVAPVIQPRAYSGSPYEAASTGRRARNWNPSRLGPTAALFSSLDLLRARSRDEVRSNGWALSAVDNFESQAIGTGIRPRWNLDDETVKGKIEKRFKLWAERTVCDVNGRSNFYGLQALAAREIYEAGEVFIRFYNRPDSWQLKVPLQLQLLEGEQLPEFHNQASSGGKGTNTIRTGIEIDRYGRRVAYHFYREHPGETMFNVTNSTQYMEVDAKEILHVFKPLRAGMLRGQPHLTSVLILLHELEKYSDASVVKKQIQTMFAGFIEQINPETDVLPTDQATTTATTPTPAVPPFVPPGIEESGLETGTLQKLFSGEKITFPTLPAENDIETFLKVHLHKFCVGAGGAYHQITGDTSGQNYTTIRSSLVDFRRKVEQFQYNVLVEQLCRPVAERWIVDAILSGALPISDFSKDPEKYLDIDWTAPKWAWVDPLKDVQAAKMAVRCGFDSRRRVVAETGEDAVLIDREQEEDNSRADDADLIYDSDGRQADGKGEAEEPDAGAGEAGGAGTKVSPVQKPSPRKAG